METPKPKVSIVVPCYNAEKFVAQTLRCITNINYPNWECLVVNDGSTDASLAIIRKFCEVDSRIMLIEQENEGPSAARNNGIKKSEGEFILPLDADDLISKEYISEAVEVFQKNATAKLVYCNARKFGHKNHFWKLPGYSFKNLLLDNMIFSTAMYRKTDYNKTRGYDPNLRLGREDWDFWIELLKSGGDVIKLEKVHFYYRTHKTSRNRLANLNISSIRKQIFENHKELYTDFIENPIQLIHEHAVYKRKYNFLRIITFRKPV